MEENTKQTDQPTEAADMDAKKPEMEKAQPKATNSSPDAMGSSQSGPNTALILGGVILVIVVLIAAAVGTFIVINNNNQSADGDSNAASSISELDPSNPEEAVATLNKQFEDVALVLTSGDISKAEEAFGDLSGGLENAEFVMDMNFMDPSGDIDMTMTGRVQTLEDGKANFEGEIEISGNIPDLGDITSPIMIEFKVVDEVAYFNISNLPLEFSQLLLILGLEEGQWYSIPADEETLGSTSSITGSDPAAVKELEELLSKNDLFINGTAAPDRVVSGVTTKCMTVEINGAALSETSTSADTYPIEICSPMDELLPIFFGIEAEESGSDVELGFSINGLDDSFTISAPSGAQDLEELLELLGSGGGFGF